jgi:phosphoglycerate dehydrogenase-like enzyme
MGGGEHKEAVLVTLPMQKPDAAIEKLQAKFPHLKITYRNVPWSKDRAELEKYVPIELWKDATVLLTLAALPPKPEDAPLLDFIQLFSAGSNQLASHPIYTDTDIPIATASGVHGPQIAEWVIMTHLIHTHKYNQLYEAQKESRWAKDGYKVRDAVGMRVGVLGYGSIGRQVGRVAKAMGESFLYLYCW